jgi:hypothetical protein
MDAIFAIHPSCLHDVERVVEYCCGSFSGALLERRTGKGYLARSDRRVEPVFGCPQLTSRVYEVEPVDHEFKETT